MGGGRAPHKQEEEFLPKKRGIEAEGESIGQGADPYGLCLCQQFKPEKGIGNAGTCRSDRGQADVLFRRIPVPVIALVLLTALSLALILGIIIQAAKLSEVPGYSSARPPADPCADGWIWYRRKCYFFSVEIRDWNESQSFCASHNASLAHMETRQELDFMLRYKGPSDHWIGLRREQGQPWKWPDGSEFNNLFPILAESDCAYLNHASIRSASCLMHRKWICTESGHSHF
ncbi:early activation antigen CD69-like [Rhinatrema bivittatum]|uniref:early activation antigen CD69-like n=1 Tax=Rhinatrema bivittatum TaxID=194408 RepID=UPI001125E6C2|nr:early activation antigen CD69-like [Rhinatrema bivittatum]